MIRSQTRLLKAQRSRPRINKKRRPKARATVLAFRALGYLVIGLLSVTLLVLSLVSAGKEQRPGERLKGLVFFTLAVIIGLFTVVGLLTQYIQQAVLFK